jgi:hypothetical protein
MAHFWHKVEGCTRDLPTIWAAKSSSILPVVFRSLHSGIAHSVPTFMPAYYQSAPTSFPEIHALADDLARAFDRSGARARRARCSVPCLAPIPLEKLSAMGARVWDFWISGSAPYSRDELALAGNDFVAGARILSAGVVLYQCECQFPSSSGQALPGRLEIEMRQGDISVGLWLEEDGGGSPSAMEMYQSFAQEFELPLRFQCTEKGYAMTPGEPLRLFSREYTAGDSCGSTADYVGGFRYKVVTPIPELWAKWVRYAEPHANHGTPLSVSYISLQMKETAAVDEAYRSLFPCLAALQHSEPFSLGLELGGLDSLLAVRKEFPKETLSAHVASYTVDSDEYINLSAKAGPKGIRAFLEVSDPEMFPRIKKASQLSFRYWSAD